MKLSLKLLAALVAISLCRQTSAATFTIADGDVAALITAINTSNSNGVDDTIELATNGTYTLTAVNNGTNGLPVIGSDTAHKLVIHGNGATLQRSTAGGTPAFRIFYIGTGADVAISGLKITNGSASGDLGGGIYNDHAMLTVTNSTVSGNSAGFGGGIYNDGYSGSATLTISNSTVSGNSASSWGGGIYNDGGHTGNATLTVTNSTVSGNSAGGYGGGVLNDGFGGSAPLTITNSTFSGNSAGVGGGGIFNDGTGSDSATLTIGDTILNAGALGANISNSSGTVTSLGYNLSSDNGGGFLTVTGDQIATNPMLGALAYYGGPTATHILLTGSPAIDKGKNVNSLATDQRGFSRTVDDGSIANASGGDGTDIGAFERQPSDIDPTLIVTKTADTNDGTCDADCSLREAITAANASAPDDAIYFAVTGTITLNSLGALPALDSNMKILGPGANALTVKRDSGASAFRIFTVNSGKTVTISGLTITNGSGGSGGTGINGGGIDNDHATLTVSNCTVRGNSVSGGSGGGGGVGGGIYNNHATLTITNSTLSGNSAVNGGGISNDGGDTGSATLTITNSTLSDNFSDGAGGGIINDSHGGGSATLTVSNSTLSGNSSFSVGGIFNFGEVHGTGTLTISDTILNASSGANIYNDAGTVTSLGYNLSSDAGVTNVNGGTGGLTATGDQTSKDPMLGPLQDNGGPTFTHELLSGSPAIDKGKNMDSLTTDQRGPGFDRTFDDVSTANATGGDGTDIGAFEVQCTEFPPVVTLKAATVLKPNVNHSYRTFMISNMVQSATDACGGDLINSVVIEKATSDEVENSPDPGDGNTVNDIVIASDCKSVQLRSERDGTKDGRVYLVTVAVSDSSSNVGRATYKVSVPVGKNPAVDSGVHYTVTGSCGP
jgi:CSLREA domain-containing protein